MTSLPQEVDVAVIGGGFGGTIVAMVLAAQGRSVTVLERDRLPRFAIGESSTPLANLVLEGVCDRYGLDEVRPLCKYGPWRRAYPHIDRGAKRGFSFIAHRPRGASQAPLVGPGVDGLGGREGGGRGGDGGDGGNGGGGGGGGGAVDREDRADSELLVAASPSEEVADTHWLRADVDHFLAQAARARGVHVLEGASVDSIEQVGQRWDVTVGGEPRPLRARFVIDASGGAGPLASAVGVRDATDTLVTTSRAVFAHFEGVRRWGAVVEEAGGSTDHHPFPVDDAALHHLTPEGWVWLLRFDSGLTSAGLVVPDAPGGGRSGGPAGRNALLGEGAEERVAEGIAEGVGVRAARGSDAPEQVWRDFLTRYPAVAAQFAEARAVRPLQASGRLQRRLRPAAGGSWAMLPSAAYFVDPLLSTGNAHTLMGVERLGRVFEVWPDEDAMAERLVDYDARLQREIDFVDDLIGGCYAALGTPRLLFAHTMLYFAGAHFAETKRRRGGDGLAEGFLSAERVGLREAARAARRELQSLSGRASTPTECADFEARIRRAIEPVDLIGLCDPARNGMYPYA